jgi:hypothetical protein
MASLVILYDNYADAGIFASGYGSWLSALPLANMQDPDIQKVARSTDAQSSSTRFRIDLGSNRSVDGLAFGPANLSPSATWELKGFSDSAYSVLVYGSGTQTVPGAVIDWTNTAAWLEWEDSGFWYGLPEALDELPQYLFHIKPTTPAVAQYWQLEVFDSGNADGFVQIGRLLIARAFRPSVNYSEDNSLVVDPITDVEESQGGLRSYWERGVRRKASFALPFLTESEIFGDVFRMVLRAGISRHVFVVPDPGDTNTGNRRSFLATLSKAPDLRQLLVQRGSTAIVAEEVL